VGVSMNNDGLKHNKKEEKATTINSTYEKESVLKIDEKIMEKAINYEKKQNPKQNHNESEIEDKTPDASTKFPIVGIGASAGGLLAFEAFFKGAPKDVVLDMAFVLVQHLAPDHKSLLAEIIKRYTDMTVHEVEDGMNIEPNSVYIIPPNKDMALLKGTLQLFDPLMKRGHNKPIDFFFQSMASDQHEKAISIILSGTGNDGTIGLHAIKKEGGLVIVESPSSAEYDGMPRSAIDAGLDDLQLAPEEMIGQIIAYINHNYKIRRSLLQLDYRYSDNFINKIFVLLRSETGHDFSEYKLNTLKRRIERRLYANNIEKLEDYVKYLHKTSTEVHALFSDMLIGVTNFFRDKEAFQALEENVIPELFKNKPVGSTIRIWCVGCSTGEEAYSIAILIQEELERIKKGYHIQIFATDIDKDAIASARAGLFLSNISSDVSEERLERFFTSESNGTFYRIKRIIRDMLVFSEHSLIKDPPFSKLDFIVCRNLLIYLQSELQYRIIPLFHYALKESGFLFLGSSETIGDYSMLFHTLDNKHKIFRKKEDFGKVNGRIINHFVPSTVVYGHSNRQEEVIHQAVLKEPLREIIEKAILSESGLVGALVDEQANLLYIYGRTGSFFELSPGESGINNILKMAREGLKTELKRALISTVSKKETIRTNGIHIKVNGHYAYANLTVKPLKSSNVSIDDHYMYAVILEEVKPNKLLAEKKSSKSIKKQSGHDESIEALKIELKIKEKFLESTNADLEIANQELKSFNEEMQSINEELQSTNEELETSKEELQSTNEELNTVNTELQLKVNDFSRINNDMNNLLAGTNIATIFLDYQLKIMRFTPTIVRIINLISTDVGRSIEDISFNILDNSEFITEVKAVLDTLIPRTRQVKSLDGLWFNMSIQPYRTIDNVIEGAVVTYIDITESKQILDKLRVSETRYRKLFENTREGILILDESAIIRAVNPYLIQLSGYLEDTFMNKVIWDIDLFEDIVSDQDSFEVLKNEKIVRYHNRSLKLKEGKKIQIEFISTSYMVDDKLVIQCNIREIVLEDKQ